MQIYIQFNYHIYFQYNSKLEPIKCNVYWFIYFYRRSTCFRRFLRSSSGVHNCTYSFRYCQPILLLAAIHDSSKQQYCLTITEAVCTVMYSWWWVEEPPETCRASVEINKSRNVAFVGWSFELYLRCTDIWMSNLAWKWVIPVVCVN